MTNFVIWCPDLGHKSRADGQDIQAEDAYDAAGKWLEVHDGRVAGKNTANGDWIEVVIVYPMGNEFKIAVSAEHVTTIEYMFRPIGEYKALQS